VLGRELKSAPSREQKEIGPWALRELGRGQLSPYQKWLGREQEGSMGTPAVGLIKYPSVAFETQSNTTINYAKLQRKNASKTNKLSK
jgi:hypothetical protein